MSHGRLEYRVDLRPVIALGMMGILASAACGSPDGGGKDDAASEAGGTESSAAGAPSSSEGSGGSPSTDNPAAGGPSTSAAGTPSSVPVATGGTTVVPPDTYTSSCDEQQCTADEICAPGPAGTYCVHPCEGQPCAAGEPYCTRTGGLVCVK